MTSAGGAARSPARNGGAIAVTAAAVALAAVDHTDAGDATSDPLNGNGGVGGPVTIKATAASTTGALSAHGGSGRVLGYGGAGGAVSVTGDRVTTGSITTLGENLSASGGAVALRAQTGLLVAGAIDTSGARRRERRTAGGGGGPILLLAAHGPLTLGGRLRSEGGAGGTASPQGARGGNGGAIEIVVSVDRSILGRAQRRRERAGTAASRADLAVRGGNGGRVRVWAQQPSLILLQLVDSGGGTGDPNGADGPQTENAAPTTFTISKTRTLAFTLTVAGGRGRIASSGASAERPRSS